MPTQLKVDVSPLQWEVWQECLAPHSDEQFIDYIVSGIRDGFRIGFNYSRYKCRTVKENMRSALEHADVVREYLAKECALGRVLGPFDPVCLPDIHVSRFGVIPKGTSGQWRLILDLLSPDGHSVNDGINSEICSLSYVTVDDAAKAILLEGSGALLAKVDIKSAYRIVPVHPEDRSLLGMRWDGALYVDAALPFGLRSAPKIFSAMADALEWRLKYEGVETIFHYLDDFLIVAPPGSSRCAENLDKLLSLFKRLQIPIAPEKLEGPTTRLTFLGIELDTRALILRLPDGKLAELKALLADWMGKKSCLKKDLQSLTGKLQHASKVVRPGRTFMRRMFDLLKGISRKQQFIRLNTAFRSDLVWWYVFLEKWNGTSMMPTELKTPRYQLITDASGTFGCGAYSENRWLQYQWPIETEAWSIVVKELIPIVMALILWGQYWSGNVVLMQCDNRAVVDVLNSGFAKDSILMHLLRCVFFISAHFEVTVKAAHIPGRENIAADALSRNNLCLFRAQVPQADPESTPIPGELVDLLVHQQPDWMSTAWSRLFRNCLRQA